MKAKGPIVTVYTPPPSWDPGTVYAVAIFPRSRLAWKVYQDGAQSTSHRHMACTYWGEGEWVSSQFRQFMDRRAQ